MGAAKDRPVIHMLVMETDEQHPKDRKEKGSFGELLHRHFDKAGREHDPPLGVETDHKFVVGDKGGRVPTFDEVKDYDAILLTGSMYDAHGENQWILDLLALLKGKSSADFSLTLRYPS